MDKLVGLAAVQQSPDGRKGIQYNGLRVGVNVVLKHNSERQTLFIKSRKHAQLNIWLTDGFCQSDEIIM